MDKQTPESIDILIDFYNLRIEPDLSDSAKRIVKKRDMSRIRRFMEKYADHILLITKLRSWKKPRKYDLVEEIKKDKKKYTETYYNFMIIADRLYDLSDKDIENMLPEDGRTFNVDYEPPISADRMSDQSDKDIENMVTVDDIPNQLDDDIQYDEIQYDEIKDEIEDDIEDIEIYLTTTLSEYQHNTDTNWFESDDFKALMIDYYMVRCTVDNILLNTISADSRSWLRRLSFELEDIQTQERKIDPFLFIHPKALEESTNGCLNLDDVTLCDTLRTRRFIDWRGVGIFHIGRAIRDGLFSILRMNEITIYRCVIEGCDRIFRVKRRGGEKKIYCGESCRKKAYNMRKLQA